jgi:predicted signal transduction protein with EAL and GGDEF domain/DNA-binding response OmpR family regulator
MPENRFMNAPLDPDSRRLVLVVDDEPMMRLLARESLEGADFRVVEAADGQAAVEICRERQPQIVLLDVNMPILDGFETCRRLRDSSFARHIPILMMTGLDDLDSIRRSYEAGATDFVNKPINWLILAQRVEYMLRASRTADDLRLSQSRLADAQRIARLGYWELFPGSRHLHCSRLLGRILGRLPGHLPTTADEYLGLVHPEGREAVAKTIDAALEGVAAEPLEYRLQPIDGHDRWVRQEAEIRRDDKDQVVCVAAAIQDVTRRKEATEKIRKLSFFDELTGLPNRRSFVERFEQAAQAARRYDRKMAVLALDLDRLKRVNDTLGHAAGDEILCQTAQRLLGTLRSSDVLSRTTGDASPAQQMDFVARLGSDEFVVLLTEIGRAQDAAAVARRIGQVLADPFPHYSSQVFLSASLGLAIYPHDGQDAESLIQRATTARNHAKEQGGNCYRYFDSSMNDAALERLDLEGALRLALERDEFELWYQPQYETATGTLTGAEALVRWRHPQRGLVLPLDFIPLAEEAGLIEQLGEWCLREACVKAREWNGAHPTPLRIAVNVSGKQFESGALLATVTRALRDCQLDPQLLELELTEGVLMKDLEGAVETLAALRELGPKLAIDDFGVGYSSLNHLMRFGVDRLKIDRSFVRGLPDCAENRGIVKAVISMAQSMGIEVVGEGVEDVDQLEFLRTEGCDEIQGFLMSKPVPAVEFERQLDEAIEGSKGMPRMVAAG